MQKILSSNEIEERFMNKPSFLNQVLDSLTAHIVVLDERGYIIHTNQAWKDFAEDNGLKSSDYSLGLNYIDLCESVSGENSGEGLPMAAGIRSVLTGEKTDFFQTYPCHSPDEQRWFQARVSAIAVESGTYVIIVHENITEVKRAIQHQELSEERLRNTFDFAPIGMGLGDKNGNLIQVNRSACHLIGYEEEELIGRNFAEFTHPDDLKKNIHLQKQLFDGEIVHYTVEKRYRHKQGHYIDIELCVSLVRDSNGLPVYSIIQGQDVSERRKHEEESRKYEQIISSTPELMSLIDDDYTYSAVNDNYLAAFKKSRGEIVGHHVMEVYGKDQFESLIKPNLDRCYKGKKNNVQHWVDFRKGRRYMESLFTPIFEDGKVTGAVVSSRDITDRKLAEEKFRLLLESAPDAMVFVDKHGRIVLLNQQTEALFGYSKKELVGEKIEKLIPPRFHDHHRKLRKGYSHNSKPRSITTVLNRRLFGRHKTGRDFPVELSLNPIETEEGTLISSTIRDVTERIQAEEALRFSEKKFSTAFHSSPDAISISTVEDGVFLEINKAFEKITGYSSDEVIGRSVFDFDFWINTQDRDELLNKLSKEKIVSDFNVKLQNRFGELHSCQMSAGIIEIGDQPYVLIITRDITLREQAQMALRQSEQRLQLALDAVDGGIWDWNIINGKFYFTDQWYQMLEYDAAEPLPEITSWQELLHPGESIKNMQKLNSYLNNQSTEYHSEHRMRTQSGTYIWVLSSGHIVSRDNNGKPTRMIGIDLNVTRTHELSDQLRDLATELGRAEASERRRLATYLHDNIAQTLAMTKIKVNDFRKSSCSSAEIEMFGILNDNLSTVIQDIRSMTFELASPILYELGLEAALEDLIARFQGQHDINCVFSCKGKLDKLNDEGKVQVYQAVRELLNNIEKHAAANNVDITIWRSKNNMINVKITDDGKGFEVPEDGFRVSRTRGYGLFNLSQRFTNLGGNMEVSSQPGSGSQILLSMPMNVFIKLNKEGK